MWEYKPETLWEKLKWKYYDLVPYEYRPHELWYKLKCWAWHRYTTTKPRWLGHTYCDTTTLLPFTMFELLVDFLEKECSPGIVDWYAADFLGNYVDGDKSKGFVMDELLRLRNWWENTYIPFAEGKDEFVNNCYERAKLTFKKVNDGLNEEERKAMDELHAYEDKMEQDLENNMISLIKLRHRLWT